MVGFHSASLFSAMKWEAVTKGGTRGIDHLMQRTQGASIVKGWEDKTAGAFQINSHKTIT